MRTSLHSATSTLSSTVDVAIVGGGPAGAVTAQQLALRGRRVALIEGDASAPVVGDHLPFAGRALLARIGAWSGFLATDPLASMGVRSCWDGDEVEASCVLQPGGAGWHLDRASFDAMLRELAGQAGALRLTNTWARTVDGGPGDWRIELGGEQRAWLSARWLVDASGRSAWLARRLGSAPAVLDDLYGFVRVWSGAPAAAYALVEACEQGWWYSVALPHGRGVAMFMTDVTQTGARDWRRWWQGSATAARFGSVPALTATRGHRATSQWVALNPSLGWTCVGDAALARDPLSSLGLTSALASAPACAAALDAALAEDTGPLARYANMMHDDARAYVDARARVYGREGRFHDAPFWSARRERSSYGLLHK